MPPVRYLNWTYGHKSCDLVTDNSVVYKVRWAPNTLADQVLNGLAPLPPTEWTGVLIDGNTMTQLSDAEITAFRASRTDESMAAAEEGVAKWDAENTAEAVRSSVFLSLPVVEGQGEASTEPDVAAAKPKHFLMLPRSVREVENLLAVRGRPHLVQVVGRTPSNELVLEHAGRSLTEWMLLPPKTAPELGWALDVARALGTLHTLGIVHKDITTNNVVVAGPHAVLCDLECGPSTLYVVPPDVVLAHTFEADAGGLTGTFDLGPPSDVFAFGLLLWSIEKRNTPRPHAAAHLERSGPFADIMDDCLCPDPARRPTMDEVVERIQAVLAS